MSCCTSEDAPSTCSLGISLAPSPVSATLSPPMPVLMTLVAAVALGLTYGMDLHPCTSLGDESQSSPPDELCYLCCRWTASNIFGPFLSSAIMPRCASTAVHIKGSFACPAAGRAWGRISSGAIGERPNRQSRSEFWCPGPLQASLASRGQPCAIC